MASHGRGRRLHGARDLRHSGRAGVSKAFDRIAALRGRPAPAPLPHFPEMDGRTVRAQCIEVTASFSRRWGRGEIHLYWKAQEGSVKDEVFWLKLNDYEVPGRGSNLYKWYSKLFGVPRAGTRMSPMDFKGVDAEIRLRTSKSAPPYTIVDPAHAPNLVSERAETEEIETLTPKPKTLTPTLTQNPNPLPDTHDQPTQTRTHTQEQIPIITADEIVF